MSARAVLLAKIPPRIREPIREVRNFLRFPLVLRQRARGPLVVLYGIPYSDWNSALTQAGLWEGIAGYVVRMPAVGRAPLLWKKSCDAVVLPMKESHSLFLPDFVRSLSPSSEALHVLGDKARFAAYVAREGLKHLCPQTYRHLQDAQFPCVLKRTDCSASYGISLVSSPVEVEFLLQTPVYRGKNYILQAAIGGATDYCTYCIFKDGLLLWSRTFVNDVEMPLMIRDEDNTLHRTIIPTPDYIIQQIQSVLAPLAYSGPCNVDYKLDGQLMRIFEINPRLGGTLMQSRFRKELREALAIVVANAS